MILDSSWTVLPQKLTENLLTFGLLVSPAHGIWAWLAQGQQRGLSHRGRTDDPLTHTTPPADLPLPDKRLYLHWSKLLMYIWPQTLFMHFSRLNKFWILHVSFSCVKIKLLQTVAWANFDWWTFCKTICLVEGVPFKSRPLAINYSRWHFPNGVQSKH